MIKKILSSFLSLVLVFGMSVAAHAYEIPSQDSKGKFFYIFGPQGEVLDGKETDEVNFYVDVPADTTEPVTIKVYDPDTGGEYDAGTVGETEMEFSVSGSSALDKQTFGGEPDYDNKWFQFGPYSVDKGEKVGNKSRFNVKVKSLRGDGINLFALSIRPDSSDSFSDKFTFRLLPKTGSRITFYPEVPAGISKLIVRNFDLDAEGGTSSLYDPATRQTYKVNDSTSGQWTETEIPMTAESTHRLEYRVTTAYQTRGNAGVQFKDDKGNILPIYFRKGPQVVKVKPAPAPVVPQRACNTFYFDARKSSDPAKKNLTYLWNFGDGSTSTEPVVTHTYEKGGQYKVNLEVSNNTGLHCEKSATTQNIDVNTPPTAAFTGPQMACAGTKVSFDASGSKDDEGQLTYNWNFGDGTGAEGAQVSKSYDKGGVYDVVLNVNDNANTSCSVDAARQTIRINSNPVANAGRDTSICLKRSGDKFNVALDGTGSHDPDGDKLSYSWDFGDGSTGEGARIVHEYKEGGSYTAKLSVSDNSGSECSAAVDTVNVNLNKAPVAVAGKDQWTCAGQEVTFDASGSDVQAGTNPTYTWNFGDGETATGQVVKHAYTKGGAYNAVLTIDDGGNTDCSKSVDGFKVFVNGAPSASISSIEAACTGDTVTFDATGSNDPDGNKLKYTWDFGDGTTAEGGSKVSHKYTKGGNYRVTVTVDDGSGASCAIAADSANIKVNAPPVANAGPNLTCCQDDPSAFDGTQSSDPDGDSLSYQWNFGDGSSSTDAKASHAYAQSGAYKVVLSVNDNSGTRCSTSSSGFTAYVNAQPTPVIEIKQK